VSYCWGEPNDTTLITCNSNHVSVTRSLADALRAFRDLHEIRTLWADALCIDQSDNEEEGQQVGRMGEVYANTKRALIWLGRDPENQADDAFATIRSIDRDFDASMKSSNGNYWEMPPVIEPYLVCVEESKWTGITALLNLPWFRRVWTVQASHPTFMSAFLSNTRLGSCTCCTVPHVLGRL
jgi:hypothetical protein